MSTTSFSVANASRRSAPTAVIGIRIFTFSTANLAMWPVSIHVRGSESEDEVRVDVPKRHLSSAIEAIEYGYECAILWIDAHESARLTLEEYSSP